MPLVHTHVGHGLGTLVLEEPMNVLSVLGVVVRVQIEVKAELEVEEEPLLTPLSGGGRGRISTWHRMPIRLPLTHSDRYGICTSAVLYQT